MKGSGPRLSASQTRVELVGLNPECRAVQALCEVVAVQWSFPYQSWRSRGYVDPIEMASLSEARLGLRPFLL